MKLRGVLGHKDAAQYAPQVLSRDALTNAIRGAEVLVEAAERLIR